MSGGRSCRWLRSSSCVQLLSTCHSYSSDILMSSLQILIMWIAESMPRSIVAYGLKSCTYTTDGHSTPESTCVSAFADELQVCGEHWTVLRIFIFHACVVALELASSVFFTMIFPCSWQASTCSPINRKWAFKEWRSYKEMCDVLD